MNQVHKNVSAILQAALSGDDQRYRNDGGFIRWGMVEREILALITAGLEIAAQDAAAAERARLIEAIRDQIEIVNDAGDLRMVDALVAIHDAYDAAQATPDAAGPAGGE